MNSSSVNDKQYVIVGLGNPGRRYEFTRHNAGWMVAKALAESLGLGFKEEKRYLAWAAKGRCENAAVHILLPATYMNESGRAVRLYLDFYKLRPENLIVISDDVELDFNRMRLRSGGSSGGHNGLKSIESHLGTQNYIRLRMGVGRDPSAASLADYVLEPFKPDEFALLDSFIERGADVVRCLMKEQITDVMNKVN